MSMVRRIIGLIPEVEVYLPTIEYSASRWQCDSAEADLMSRTPPTTCDMFTRRTRYMCVPRSLYDINLLLE